MCVVAVIFMHLEEENVFGCGNFHAFGGRKFLNPVFPQFAIEIFLNLAPYARFAIEILQNLVP